MCTTPVPLEFYACICEEVRTTVGVNLYTRTRTNETSEMDHVRMHKGRTKRRSISVCSDSLLAEFESIVIV